MITLYHRCQQRPAQKPYDYGLGEAVAFAVNLSFIAISILAAKGKFKVSGHTAKAITFSAASCAVVVLAVDALHCFCGKFTASLSAEKQRDAKEAKLSTKQQRHEQAKRYERAKQFVDQLEDGKRYSKLKDALKDTSFPELKEKLLGTTGNFKKKLNDGNLDDPKKNENHLIEQMHLFLAFHRALCIKLIVMYRKKPSEKEPGNYADLINHLIYQEIFSCDVGSIRAYFSEAITLGVDDFLKELEQ